MIFEPSSSRSVLQRRSSTSIFIQAGLDSLAVTGVAWYLIDYHIGYITQAYVIMVLLLLGALDLPLYYLRHWVGGLLCLLFGMPNLF